MITLTKIAKEAHVSLSTASKAFSGSPEVNEETRQHIFDVATRYGCFKKFFNAKYDKYVVAVICPEFCSIRYAAYLSNLHRYLKAGGCEVCVAESNFSAEKERELLDYYCRYADVDAVIMIHPQIEEYDLRGIPALCLGHSFSGKNCPSILCDFSQAFDQCMDYLLSAGTTSIGFIGETLTDGKLSCWKTALSRRGIAWKTDYVRIVQQRFEAGGYEAMEQILNAGSYPRVMVCAYDNMAIGAIRCIADHGLRVPEDIAVMGMDDIPQAPFLCPPLASIATRNEERCQLAANTVLQMLNGQTVPDLQTVQAEFQLRDSLEIGTSLHHSFQ